MLSGQDTTSPHGCRNGASAGAKTRSSLDTRDSSQWSRLVSLLCAPIDGASLAVWRVMFGYLMLLDALHERGFMNPEEKYGQAPDACFFPLFHFLAPLSVDAFYVMGGLMVLACFGVILGFFYRTSLAIFAIIYWYVFFLDKRWWNNHSYLFGTLSVVMIALDCNACWSLDAVLFRRCNNHNGVKVKGGRAAACAAAAAGGGSRASCSRAWHAGTHVPLWNLFLLRILNFVVYFIAGLKKALEPDWVFGQSMTGISRKPFMARYVKPMLVPVLDSLNLTFEKHFCPVFINGGGLIFDLFIGWGLAHPRARPISCAVCLFFHGMNTQLFSIGMFPYMCMALLTIWWHPSWPRHLAAWLGASVTQCRCWAQALWSARRGPQPGKPGKTPGTGQDRGSGRSGGGGSVGQRGRAPRHGFRGSLKACGAAFFDYLWAHFIDTLLLSGKEDPSLWTPPHVGALPANPGRGCVYPSVAQPERFPWLPATLPVPYALILKPTSASAAALALGETTNDSSSKAASATAAPPSSLPGPLPAKGEAGLAAAPGNFEEKECTESHSMCDGSAAAEPPERRRDRLRAMLSATTKEKTKSSSSNRSRNAATNLKGVRDTGGAQKSKSLIGSTAPAPSRVADVAVATATATTSTDAAGNPMHTTEAEEDWNARRLVQRMATVRPGVQRRHRIVIGVLVAFIAFEAFLPYSHFITRGYNGWTQGLYGYSWDMMIHSWHEQHTRIEIVPVNATRGVKDSSIFLDPHKFVYGRTRYKTHPDMIYQYVGCLKRELTPLFGEGFGIYLDLWNSMNNRFQQRFVDPNFNFGGNKTLTWSPWEDTPWIRPCIFNFDDYRNDLEEFGDRLAEQEKSSAVFVADFPGQSLVNYLNGTDYTNVVIQVLSGEVEVALEGGARYSLLPGGNYTLPIDESHEIFTLGDEPSTYVYIGRDIVSEVGDDTDLVSEASKSSTNAGAHFLHGLHVGNSTVDMSGGAVRLRSGNFSIARNMHLFSLVAFLDDSDPRGSYATHAIRKQIHKAARLIELERRLVNPTGLNETALGRLDLREEKERAGMSVMWSWWGAAKKITTCFTCVVQDTAKHILDTLEKDGRELDPVYLRDFLISYADLGAGTQQPRMGRWKQQLAISAPPLEEAGRLMGEGSSRWKRGKVVEEEKEEEDDEEVGDYEVGEDDVEEEEEGRGVDIGVTEAGAEDARREADAALFRMLLEGVRRELDEKARLFIKSIKDKERKVAKLGERNLRRWRNKNRAKLIALMKAELGIDDSADDVHLSVAEEEALLYGYTHKGENMHIEPRIVLYTSKSVQRLDRTHWPKNGTLYEGAINANAIVDWLKSHREYLRLLEEEEAVLAEEESSWAKAAISFVQRIIPGAKLAAQFVGGVSSFASSAARFPGNHARRVGDSVSRMLWLARNATLDLARNRTQLWPRALGDTQWFKDQRRRRRRMGLKMDADGTWFMP